MATYVFRRVTRLSGTPHHVAAGVACGVAISFTPFIGFHLLGAFLLSALVRGNYIAAAVGTLVGNPWTFPFIWITTYKLGHALLGGRAASLEPLHHFSFTTLFADLEAVFWPMTAGGVPLGVIAGLATYFPLVRVITVYQMARARRRARRRQDRSVIKAPGASPGTGVP
jgi:uncharacterized protein (DUF2062 family)